MRILVCLLFGAGLGAASASATAQDWNGGVAGLSVGHDWTESRSTFNSMLALPIGPVPVQSFDNKSIGVGALTGYRWQVGGLIVGTELDVAATVSDGRPHSAAPYYSVEPKWHGSLRAVAGVPAGKALIFATAGLAAGKFSFHHAPGVPWTTVSHDETPRGFVFGAGIELAAGRLHPRIEYRHTRYRQTTAEANTIIYHDRLSAHAVHLAMALHL